MNNVADQLDKIEERVMEGLKDFQKATVERIDYLFRQGQRRVLVSDEVGLGKTLIARGTVAKTAKLRREKGDRLFKVVYICSNAAIADQNIRKLRITSEARRLVEGGGVSVNDEKIIASNWVLPAEVAAKGEFVLHKGKKVHLRVMVVG